MPTMLHRPRHLYQFSNICAWIMQLGLLPADKRLPFQREGWQRSEGGGQRQVDMRHEVRMQAHLLISSCWQKSFGCN
jgi:hypothetical protein